MELDPTHTKDEGYSCGYQEGLCSQPQLSPKAGDSQIAQPNSNHIPAKVFVEIHKWYNQRCLKHLTPTRSSRRIEPIAPLLSTVLFQWRMLHLRMLGRLFPMKRLWLPRLARLEPGDRNSTTADDLGITVYPIP